MSRGDNVKKYWGEVKGKAEQENKNIWDVVNPTVILTLKNCITIKSIAYSAIKD